YEAGETRLAVQWTRVTLVAGGTELVSHALTPSDDGQFALPIEAQVQGPLAIEVQAFVRDARDQPLIAVAHPGDQRLWSWRFEVCASGCNRAIDAGELVLREGSGAARALDLVAAS